MLQNEIAAYNIFVNRNRYFHVSCIKKITLGLYIPVLALVIGEL